MDSSLLLLGIVVELMIVVRSIRRFGWLPSPTLILATIMGQQIVLWLIATRAISYNFLFSFGNGGVDTYFDETEMLYGFLFLFFWVAHLRLEGKPVIQDIAKGNLEIETEVGAIGNLGLLVACVVAAGEVANALILNWDVVWRNNQYLAMSDPNLVLSNARLSIILVALMPLGILSSAFCAFSAAQGSRAWAATFAGLTLLPFLYALGAHSRTAAAIPIVFAITLQLADPKRLRWLKLTAAVLALFCVMSALVGRGVPVHGISAVPDTVSNVADNASVATDTVLTNLFEGSIDIAESKALGAQYPTRYKVLSFSPLPSMLDHYAAIRDTYQIRLSVFAPMSGYVELQNFGEDYILAFALIVFWITRLVFRIAPISRIIFIMTNLFLFMGFYTLNAYPVRNGLKFFWLAALVAIITLYVQKIRDFGGWQTYWQARQTDWRRLVTRGSMVGSVRTSMAQPDRNASTARTDHAR